MVEAALDFILSIIKKLYQAWLLGYFSNPWALLILVFLLYKLTRLLAPLLAAPLSQRWADWSTARQQRAEAAAYKKDPDLYRAKMEQLETARLRMQERWDMELHLPQNTTQY